MLLGEGRALALSPDGTVGSRGPHLPGTHLALLPTAAGEARRLEGGGLMYRRASSSRDGKRFVFVADPEMGDMHGYIQSVAGGPPKELEEGLRPVIVSPDGRTWSAGVTTVCSSCESTAELLLGRSPGILGVSVRWSADGRAIYAYEETDRLTLYRLDLATGRNERLKELFPPDKTGFLRYGIPPGRDGLRRHARRPLYAYSYSRTRTA